MVKVGDKVRINAPLAVRFHKKIGIVTKIEEGLFIGGKNIHIYFPHLRETAHTEEEKLLEVIDC